jgi:multiple sugar transport system substrate-binding protein
MRKISLVVATAAVAALTLTGCESSNSGSANGDGKVTITFAHWGNNQENATLKSMVALFEKAHPKIRVQANWVQGDYAQKVETSIAGGNAPTVLQTSDTFLANFANAYREAKVDPSAYYSPNIARAMRLNGRYYGVPFTVKTKAMAVDKKIFAKAGVPLPGRTPMTPGAYASLAAKLTSGSGKSKVYGSAPLWFQGWLTAEGGSFYNADGTKCTNGSPAAVRTADFIIRAQSPKNGFTPSYLGAQGQDMFDWLSIGRLAMQPDFGPWNIAQLEQLPNHADYRLVPVPGKGEPMEIDGLSVAKTASGAQAAAQKFITFMSTDTAAQERLTTRSSSLGLPVVQSAVKSFRAAAPDLDLKVFLDAVDQSTVTTTPKQDAQIQSTFNNDLFSRTAIGSGHESPATVLPQLEKACQRTLDSGVAGQ